MLNFFLTFITSVFSLGLASHFLGASLSYRHVQEPTNNTLQKTILVEITFHISNHYFICTPEEVNAHQIVYLIGESVKYDEKTKSYLWFQTNSIKRNKSFYNIQCFIDNDNRTCKNFDEKTWGYCEGVNKENGYSILRRQFLFKVEKFKPIQLHYVC